MIQARLVDDKVTFGSCKGYFSHYRADIPNLSMHATSSGAPLNSSPIVRSPLRIKRAYKKCQLATYYTRNSRNSRPWTGAALVSGLGKNMNHRNMPWLCQITFRPFYG